ncbi:MAG: disulfide bond formation protein B [Hyphomicrobiales bacterium]|nr:disulfide bond formation protein B [Hyphomicrobiales bacterium]MCP5373440.1 disulfide bond formation protein B [Hyphomicrobiales bacterium]
MILGYDTHEWRRLVPLGILAACVVSLTTAYTAQYGFDLEPCILCLYQRVPFFVNGGLAVLLLFAGIRGNWRTWLVVVCAVVFFANSALAFYHVGVEQHWWHSVTGCGGGLPTEMSIQSMKADLLKPRVKPCDEVDFQFLGISIATYNVVYSGALGLATLVGLRLMKRSEEDKRRG